ncbi:hypothetical protein KSF78_0005179 [Schistosoma japonicum]|nr:hypothetical protein KSF78_0005179 [Schistosoma japonicum]
MTFKLQFWVLSNACRPTLTVTVSNAVARSATPGASESIYEDSTLSAAPSVSSNDAQPYVVFADSASALLSKFESLLSNGTSQSYQKDNDQVHSSVNSSCNFRPKQESNTSSEDKDKLPSFNSKTLRSLDCEESTDISTQFNVHLSELQRLIEESEKFDGMVKRLLMITKKANLGESTKLLADISKRFSELQMSFISLKESYNSLHNEPQLSPELCKVQLSSFREFLNSLSRNFDSTKECFYTIHHLVKATIEQQLANGTLQEIDHSDEENNSSLPTNPSDYIIAKDINPKLTASRASFDTSITSDRSVESNRLAVEVGIKNERESPDIISSLEAKKRELSELKAQLELLRKAEAKIAKFAPVLQNSGEDMLENKRAVSSALQSILPEVIVPKTRFATYKDVSNGSTNTKPTSDLSTETDSVTFQQPEVTCIDNTERLYVNMREARIQIEEQRDRHDHSTSTKINSVNSNAQKQLQHVSCSGASVATSQDRTTLATWGGSSPVPSCSSEASEESDEVDEASVSDSLPLSACLSATAVNTSNVNRSVPNGHSHSVTGSVAISSLDVSGEPGLKNRRTSRKCGNAHRDSSDNVYISPSGDDPYKLSLPQVGRSPSPPGHHKSKSDDMQSQDNLNSLIDQRLQSQQNPLGEQVNASTNQNTGVLSHLVVASTCNDFDDGRMSDISGAIVNERIQRLESNVAQLYQVCRCLMLENSQLNSAITQLMLHNSSYQPVPTVKPLEPSISAVGSIAFHQCHCCSSVPSYNQILLTDSGAMLYKQEHPSKSVPCPMNTCPRSSVICAPTNLGDTDQAFAQVGVHDVPQIQLLINQIMQQQSNLTQLQLELHRLTRPQTQIKPSLLSTDAHLHGRFLSHPENTGLILPPATARLLSTSVGFPASPSVSVGRQNNFAGTTNSQVLGHSSISPQNLTADWSLTNVPNVYQCSSEAIFSNLGQRSSLQTASVPSSLLLTNPSANPTSHHGTSVNQNNIGKSLFDYKCISPKTIYTVLVSSHIIGVCCKIHITHTLIDFCHL